MNYTWHCLTDGRLGPPIVEPERDFFAKSAQKSTRRSRRVARSIFIRRAAR